MRIASVPSGPKSQAYVAEAILWSYRSFPLDVQLATGLRLFAQLLFRESDVGIHQAPSNTAKNRKPLSGSEEGTANAREMGVRVESPV